LTHEKLIVVLYQATREGLGRKRYEWSRMDVMGGWCLALIYSF
jgi:hypothetical protein